jgi:hypothetical protein
MQRFLEYGYKDTDLYHLNLCRQFCHATRLSDITTGDGRRIHPASWSGYPTDSSGLEYEWTAHGSPSPKIWQLWQTAIRHCFLTLDTPQQILRHPLSAWTGPTPSDWQWLYSASTDRVLQATERPDVYNVYSIAPSPRRLRAPKYQLSDTDSALPSDAERTTTTAHSHFVWCHGTCPSLYVPPKATTVTDFIHENDKWAIARLHCPNEGSNIAAAMINGTAVAVCDGSFKDAFGTFRV